tara:strand:- start:3618 stop:6071 length:2454 start_codon:yes stop_codon:yes gene_type:complete
MVINFNKIEKKWQEKWESKKVFEVSEKSKKKKYYVLEMFAYPSGAGLHMGHALNYTITDIFARFKRMNGFNVFYPTGFDALGLPAENAAIKAGKHPAEYTKNSIINFVKQQKALGFSYDWRSMLSTSDSNYYKWDQWIFLKMLENGLAYKKQSPVNFCKKCNTVLANEQVHDGKCWRHGDTKVEIRHLNQWYLKITNYSNELSEGLKKLKQWPDRIKKLQKNWIGKSFGSEIVFDVDGKKWPIFTTRPDTIYGVTFMVVSAQHPRLFEIVTDKEKKNVEKFVKKLSSVSEEEIDQLEKEGVFTGSYAINPINNEKVPVYAGNFVLADYGSGMVMAVPGHDQRDYEFAKKYKIKIKEVISGGDIKKSAYVWEGKLVNSDKFNGMNSDKAKEEITKFLQKKKLGKKTINYRLRDWLVSRQRYWGTPIPIINCVDCGEVPVNEKDLPVKLPERVKFGKGNPLINAESWINVKCPKCGKMGKRETDTMDTFVNSSWYYLRYVDSKNNKEIFDKKKIDYWCPVDFYVGGAEHACMHLIYIRFYTKFLRDIGLLKFDEPAVKLFNHGMIHGEDGNKMSKSLGNTIDPLDITSKTSADALRMYLVSVASPDSDFNWANKGPKSTFKFINKIVNYFEKTKLGKSSASIESKINRGISRITEDIENLRYNLGVIKLRQLFESIEEQEQISKQTAESFLKMLSVFCPHISEELWEKIRGKGFISLADWPVADKSKIDNKLEKAEQSVSNTIGDIMNILKIIKERDNRDGEKIYVYIMPFEKEYFDEKKISERVGKDVKIFVVNDKDKYDPKGISKKSKPGKPGIYIE